MHGDGELPRKQEKKKREKKRDGLLIRAVAYTLIHSHTHTLTQAVPSRTSGDDPFPYVCTVDRLTELQTALDPANGRHYAKGQVGGLQDMAQRHLDWRAKVLINSATAATLRGKIIDDP